MQPPPLSESDRRSLDDLARDFDHSWNDGRLKQVVAQLPPPGHPLRMAALRELVRIDLKHQWARGRRARIEGYLHTFPELGTAATVAPELVLAEYEARQQAGSSADLADFEKRFPALAGRLRELLLARATVGGPAVTSPPPEATTPAVGSLPTSPSDLPPRFGPYEIVQKIGQGGMGAVYLARDTRLERQVALKVPRFTAQDGPAVLDRFYQEVKAAAALDHPNICPVYEAGCVNGTPYMTMAHIEGKPLSALIRPDRPWTPRSAALFLRKLALVVHEAHEKGVVHRDLKPSNIMINQRKEPVIMDFGLARRITATETRLTVDGSAMGTPTYMAPEQARGDLSAMGPRSDVYSLGVMLYELVTGRVPFEGRATEVLGMVLHVEPPKPSLHRPDLDPRLEAIILRAIAKGPTARHVSARELANDLKAWIDGAAVPEEAPEALPAKPSEVPTILPVRPADVPTTAPARSAPTARSVARPPAPTPRRSTPAGPVARPPASMKPSRHGWLVRFAVGLVAMLGVGGAALALVLWLGKGLGHRDEAIIADDVAECGRRIQSGQGTKEYFEKVGPGRVPIWRAAADRGSPEAQWLLSRCYQEGAGVPRDDEQAVALLRRSAEKGFAYAESNLGYCYFHGEGVGKNQTEAVRWFQKAADRGLALAQRNLAHSYKNGEGVPQDYAKAREWFQKAADQGDTNALYNLGIIYFNGQGLDQPDQAEGVRWYRRAADAGLADAQDELGRCYLHGWGVTKDAKEAVVWFRRAADQDNAFAQGNLGRCYLNGDGVPKDTEQAIVWLEKAVAQNVKHAPTNRELRWGLGDALHNRAREFLEKKDWESAGLYFRRAIDVREKLVAEVPHHFPHRHNLGLTSTGLGDVRAQANDDASAAQWYIKGSDLGYKGASEKLAEMFEKGQGVPKSASEAERLRKLAANQAIKKLTIPCKVRDWPRPVPMDVYISNSFRGTHPLDEEERRLREDHDATIPPEVKESFRKLYDISRQNNVSFVELVEHALKSANDDKNKSEDKPGAK